MSKELVVSATRHETRVAVLEDDQLVEIYFQREEEYSLAGSIHKGRVTRVLPGMQSAFVDIGLDRDAFLYVSDFFEDNEEYDQVVSNVEEQVLRLEKGAPAASVTPIDLQTATKTDPARAALEQVVVPGPVVSSVDRPAGMIAPSHDRDGRDRRGRRPRRRRGMGRGFPESKYSSPVAPVEAKPDLSEAPESPAGDDEEELPVLPGESISKYSQPESEPKPEGGDSRELRAEIWGEPMAAEEAPESLAAVPIAAEPVAVVASEPEPVIVAAEPAPAVEAEPQPQPEPQIAAAAPAEEELESSDEVLEATDDSAEESEEEEELLNAAGEEASLDESPAEGVEPARIPTSLTATLRE